MCLDDQSKFPSFQLLVLQGTCLKSGPTVLTSRASQHRQTGTPCKLSFPSPSWLEFLICSYWTFLARGTPLALPRYYLRSGIGLSRKSRHGSGRKEGQGPPQYCGGSGLLCGTPSWKQLMQLMQHRSQAGRCCCPVASHLPLEGPRPAVFTKVGEPNYPNFTR